MKDLLISIYAQINTVSSIKWVDEDFGQIDNYESQPPVALPCALVSVDQKHESIGGGAYDVNSTITVRVAHNRLGDRSAKAPTAAINNTLAKVGEAEAVRDALEGFEDTDKCGLLYLKGFTTERRTDGLSVKVITFEETHEEVNE
jgi:hypothetical protein